MPKLDRDRNLIRPEIQSAASGAANLPLPAVAEWQSSPFREEREGPGVERWGRAQRRGAATPPRRDLARRATDAAASPWNRIIAIDDKAQRVGWPSLVEGGDADGAAAIALVVDQRGRNSRQHRARQHMIGTQHMAVVVEIGL